MAFFLVSCGGGGGSTTQDPVIDSSISVSLPKSCLEILNKGEHEGSTFYTIDADGDGGLASFKVYCEMSEQGGGWTLFANHGDGVDNLREVAIVEKTIGNHGFMQAKRWRAVRNNMKTGMLFIDEHENVSMMRASALEDGNCRNIFQTNDLTLGGLLWHQENVECEVGGLDYSLILLLGKEYVHYKISGAALYQQSNVKFDVWPYSDKTASFEEQNDLRVYIK